MIRKILDCSWEHVSIATRERLESEPSIYTMAGDDGYLVYVCPEADGEPEDSPVDLLVVLAHARALGCDYVMLDRDADYVDGLPIFEDRSDAVAVTCPGRPQQ